ncbi:uncharacterized protein LOC122053768 [Zingiber officinale]|uniref:uncharacterized protein LOC122053768 n=1 Tax=Zingiber officinale TaxID=94328 RepID=UPI001C4B09E0|nr:uncharacterized protein LOC122053768 [Zingiber officinale]
MHYKYHHRLSHKGYIGLEAELREKKLIAENEEVDRSIFWRKAREDKSRNIICGVGEEGSKLSQYIATQLRASNRDSIYFIPYNTGYHWILTIINEDKNMIYLLDSLSNRNQDYGW